MGAAASPGPHRDLKRESYDAVLTLLGEIDPGTDLAHLVKRVCENDLPWVVVTTAALEAWQVRDPTGWERVREWLAARGVAIVRI